MSDCNYVFKRCGCRTDEGRRVGATCPGLRQRGHGTWYFTLELPPDRN